MTNSRSAFQHRIVSLPLFSIEVRREIIHDHRRALYYKQIAASVKQVGLIEPLVVFPTGNEKYLLLDGHVRYDTYKRNGAVTVECLISEDDEAYTYNRRVNSIPSVAQNVMLLKALDSGVSEERIAAALCVDVKYIRRKRDMLDGICEEAVQMLQTRKVSQATFTLLKRMKPPRQVEAAEHMILNSVFSSTFMKALLYATRPDMLVRPSRPQKKVSGREAIHSQFSQESENLLRDLKSLEADLGKEALTLTVFRGYIRKLVNNSKVQRYLQRKHKDIAEVFQSRMQFIPVQEDTRSPDEFDSV